MIIWGINTCTDCVLMDLDILNSSASQIGGGIYIDKIG